MDFRWVEEEDLKQKYNVFASFYDVRLQNIDIQCRNDLHIFDINSDIDTSNFKEASIPQLLMIMMNPGKSNPLNLNYTPDCYYESDYHLIRETGYVETVPDKTQFQVMRIMYNMGYSHARVINISDLRNPISGEFKVELEGIHPLSAIHSLFSEQRRKELDSILSCLDEQSVIFKAWGIDIVNKSSIFKELVGKCLVSLPDSINNLGLQGKSIYHYNHPLPSPSWIDKFQKKWLENAGQLF